jgi:hypothetical protein
MTLTRHCSVCDDERSFEQPPCADGHGAECPEFACAECGMAIVVGDDPQLPVIVRSWAA